jgi:adenosine deaminase
MPKPNVVQVVSVGQSVLLMSYGLAKAMHKQHDLMKLRLLKKIELHTHLEAYVDDTLVVQWQGQEFADGLRAQREKLFWNCPYDFDEFVHVFRAHIASLRSQDDLATLMRHALCQQRALNVRYTEFTFSSSYLKHQFGWSVRSMVERLCEELKEWNARNTSIGAVLLDITNDTDCGTADEILSCAADFRAGFIVGINYSGDEKSRCIYEFADLLSEISSNGINLTVHLGEFLEPAECVNLLERIRPKRIGHGVRLADDSSALRYLSHKGIAVELCLTSACHSGAVSTVRQFPVRKFLEHGVSVSINSDDPTLLKTNIECEYIKLIQNDLLTIHEIAAINAAAGSSAFSHLARMGSV